MKSGSALGDLVANGRTSRVFAYGRDSVVKVPRSGVPDTWLSLEAELTQAVRSAGVSAPEVRDVVSVEGRTSVVFERVTGPSMWEMMLDDPNDSTVLARQLADLHREIQQVGLPAGIPDFVDRTRAKIARAHALSAAETAEAHRMASGLPRGGALLHGDLHPGNVLMSASGPVVIDWFDATIGHPVADIVRSSILMRPAVEGLEFLHLPGSTPALMEIVHDAYVAEFPAELGFVESRLPHWEAVMAASRLAEGAQVDESGLIALWADRSKASSECGLGQLLARRSNV